MNEGFLTLKETQSMSRPDGKVLSCASCGRYKSAKSPKMKAWGNFGKGILIVGEFPDLLDDDRDKMWQSREGRYLKTALSRLGVDLFEDCASINAVNCYDEKMPNHYMIDCCRTTIVSRQIKELMPNVIIVLGDMALHSIVGAHWKEELKSIERWRGFIIPDKEYKAWVCPTFAPFEIIDADKIAELIWMKDLENAVRKAESVLPKTHAPVIHYHNDLNLIKEVVPQGSIVAFDYETTGIKPHAPGHKIICASIAVSEDVVHVFMMPETETLRKPFLEMLADGSIRKFAHNIKFEQTWSHVFLKQDVESWEWDSMLAAHIIDNRPNISGLKFQTYVNFGVSDYASEVSPWLKSVEKDGNAKNRIEELIQTEAGRRKLMEYCALDSIYEFRLAMLQRTLILNNLPF